MDTTKVNELFEKLQDTCWAQFGFQPGRISENMHYMQQVKPGVHRFRDTLCHAEIRLTLEPLNAVLFEPNKRDLHWTPDLMESYRQTDDQIKAALDEHEAKEVYVENSPLWATHCTYIRALFRDDPTYVESDLIPKDATMALVNKLLVSADADLLDVSNRLGVTDPGSLSHWLMSPYFRENQAKMWQIVLVDPRFEALVSLAPELNDDRSNVNAENKASALAEQIIDDLPRYLRNTQSRYMYIEMLIRKAISHSKAS